jgi:hypothetical protein
VPSAVLYCNKPNSTPPIAASSAIKAPESRHHRDIPDDQMSQAKTKGGHHEMTSKPVIKACDFLKIIFN